MTALTALTAQNTLGVTAVHDVPTDFVRAQIDAVFSDLDVSAVKIGMLSQPGIIKTVASGLQADAGIEEPLALAAGHHLERVAGLRCSGRILLTK